MRLPIAGSATCSPIPRANSIRRAVFAALIAIMIMAFFLNATVKGVEIKAIAVARQQRKA